MWDEEQGALKGLLAEVRVLLKQNPGDNDDLAHDQERWSMTLRVNPNQDESTLEDWRDNLEEMLVLYGRPLRPLMACENKQGALNKELFYWACQKSTHQYTRWT